MKALVRRIHQETASPFDLGLLKGHLRVADDSEDAAITNIGLTAAAELEQFAQVALLMQKVRLTLIGCDLSDGFMPLPIGPVYDGSHLIVKADGQALPSMMLITGERPLLYWQDDLNSFSPHQLEIEYIAGFGSSAADIPADLIQALLDQAALHYDGRSPMDARSLTTSPHMARVGARYRGVQL